MLLHDFNRVLPTLYGEHFLYRLTNTKIPYMEGVSFFGDLVQVLLLFCFPETFDQKTHYILSRLMFCYERFPYNTRKSRKVSSILF